MCIPCWMPQGTQLWFPEPDQNQHVKATPSLKQFFPAFVWFLIVLVLLCIPGKEMPESKFSIPDADKLVHFFMFGLMTFLFCRPFMLSDSPTPSRKKTIYLYIVLAVCFWGLATEFIQKYFVPNRDFELLDWLADSLGAFAAFIIVKRKSEQRNESIKMPIDP
jgi:VanZ family protein